MSKREWVLGLVVSALLLVVWGFMRATPSDQTTLNRANYRVVWQHREYVRIEREGTQRTIECVDCPSFEPGEFIELEAWEAKGLKRFTYRTADTEFNFWQDYE